MKTHTILRFIASIVIITFISTQCGFGTAFALRPEGPEGSNTKTAIADAIKTVPAPARDEAKGIGEDAAGIEVQIRNIDSQLEQLQADETWYELGANDEERTDADRRTLSTIRQKISQLVQSKEKLTHRLQQISDTSAAGKAGAIGDRLRTVILRTQLWRLTGVWGLDQVGVFKGASKEDLNGYMENIRDLGRLLSTNSINSRLVIRKSISTVAKTSKMPQEFQNNLLRVEDLAVQLHEMGHLNLIVAYVVEEALTHERFKAVYRENRIPLPDKVFKHPEEYHYEVNDNSVIPSADTKITDKSAWIERIPQYKVVPYIEIVPVDEIAIDVRAAGEVVEAGPHSEASAIGDRLRTIILRTQLWRLTGVWGLDQVGVFKDLPKDELGKYIDSIKAQQVNKKFVKLGIKYIAKESRNIIDFRYYLSLLESIVLQLSEHPSNLTEATVEQVMEELAVHGKASFIVEHPAVIGREMNDQSVIPSGSVNEVVQEPAWAEVVEIDSERPSLFFDHDAVLTRSIYAMQPTTAKTGIIFTSAGALAGLEIMLTKMDMPVTKLTSGQMQQLNQLAPEAVDAELQKLAADMKVNTVRLCKLEGEPISTLTTEMVVIDPAQINAQIVEVLRRFGVTFDDADPAKVEAARKAYEAASALAIGV